MRKIFIILLFPYFLEAQNMSVLFSALKSHAQIKADVLLVKKSELQKEKAQSALYPKIDLVATYDNYNEATGMLPVPPNQLIGMIKDQSVGQPFSNNIYKGGAKFSMPLFVKSIFSAAKKAEAMQKSAKARKHINLLQNEALIVGANADFKYLVSLSKAIESKRDSLLETKKSIQIKVDNGRVPASWLYKIDDSLNEIAIEQNSIELQKKKAISLIESLTGIHLSKPLSMRYDQKLEKGTFVSLKPLQEKIEADAIDVEMQKEKLYPSLYAHGSYMFSTAKAYNNNKDVNEEYGNIGVVLNIPIFQMNQYSSIDLAKVELQSSRIELQKLKDKLDADVRMLEESLSLLEHSIELYKKSIQNKQKLLDIAKVSYSNEVIPTEEYLRYEDALVMQKAKLYKTEATKWQILMQLAVIYANNIEEMVK